MKYIVNIIAIALVIVLVFLAIYLKNSGNYPLNEQIRNFSKYFSQFINVVKHNVGMEISPLRKQNLTYIEREASLREYLPTVFGQFSDRDWQNFWALIYEPIQKKQGKFKVKTYRTKDEIEDYLREHYPNSFGYFQANHWFNFWSIARVNWEESR
jgi:hypothetical protein